MKIQRYINSADFNEFMIMKQYAQVADKTMWKQRWESSDIPMLIKRFQNHSVSAFIRARLPPSGKILEGGCGLGQVVMVYADQGFDIVGVDYEQQALHRAIKERPDLKGRFLKADLEKLPYPVGSFSAYLSFGVIEHKLDHSVRIQEEAHRVLSSEGCLFLAVPFLNWFRILISPITWLKNLRRRQKGYPFYQYYYSRRAICRVLKKRGFSPLKLHPYGKDSLFGFPHFIMVYAKKA